MQEHRDKGAVVISLIRIVFQEDEGTSQSGGAAAKKEVPSHLLWHIEIDRKMHVDVKQACLSMDLPCLEEVCLARSMS